MKILSKLISFRFKRESEFFRYIHHLTGFRPNDIALYQLAFRHRSASKRKSESLIENNERLEFLGDAILGALIAEFLYEQYPDKDEGFLTSMRSKIVSRKNLNKISHKLNLKEKIIDKLDKRKAAKSLGGDALEALIGALYLDRGIEKTKEFVYSKIIHQNMYFADLERHVISYKGLFIEWAQKERKAFCFTLIDQWGQQHNMVFKMGLYIDENLITSAEGASKKSAEEGAAAKACELFNISS